MGVRRRGQEEAFAPPEKPKKLKNTHEKMQVKKLHKKLKNTDEFTTKRIK